MNPVQSDDPPAPLPAREFAPRAVSVELTGRLAGEAAALLRAAPGRLLGLYLLASLAVQLLAGVAYLAMPLRAGLASLAFSGFFCALERVYRGQAPGLRDMGRPWQLPYDRIFLLVAVGVLQVLATWLVWWLDLGSTQLDRLLSVPLAGAEGDTKDLVPSVSHPALAQMIEMIGVECVLNLPLLLLQPLCVLYDWSATRTLAANLLASLANWRWGVLMAIVGGPISLALYASHPDGLGPILLFLAVDAVSSMYLSAFTLVLLHHSLDRAARAAQDA